MKVTGVQLMKGKVNENNTYKAQQIINYQCNYTLFILCSHFSLLYQIILLMSMQKCNYVFSKLLFTF